MRGRERQAADETRSTTCETPVRGKIDSLLQTEKRIMPRTATYLIVLALAMGLLSSAHNDSTSASQEKQEAPRFRVGIDAVRIDAVVTDRDGRIVTDLTSDDFEVRQDGKRQTVTFAQFMPVLVSEPREAAPVPGRHVLRPRSCRLRPSNGKASSARWRSWSTTWGCPSKLSEHPASAPQVCRARLAADGPRRPRPHRRVERRAAVVLNRSTRAARSHRWPALERGVAERRRAFEALEQWTTFDSRTGMSDPNDFKALTQLRNSMSAAGTLGALTLAIRGTRDLPGRKAIIFVSEGFQLLLREPGDSTRLPDARVRYALDSVIDQATRAGVVIYSLDSRGLQTGGLQAADNIKRPDSDSTTMEASVRGAAAGRLELNRDTQESMAYLAEQTGGFAVLNTNDLARGLGRITDDLRGYYVIGYVPEDGTFASKGKTPRFHKIAINVRRSGLRVKTRKEFLGISDPQEVAGPATPAEQLVHAATSPFAATDIALRATALPGYAPEEGMFIRTLLHIDARALTFAGGESGRKTASVDVLGMVFNLEGIAVGHLSTGFAVALTAAAESDALRDGLAYTLRLPISRAGGYQVRFAVRDQNSGAMGSAGEFVNVDDMAGGAFALSGIVLRGDRGDSQGPGEADQIALTPAQSIRVYRPGTRLSYAYEIYNASTVVEVAASIRRGTERVFATPPSTLALPPGNDGRFTAAGGLRLGEQLPPGSYALVVSATTPDPNRKGRSRTAVQQIGFDVR